MIVVFIATCLVSFIGSLQLGPVNLYVISSTVQNNRRMALFAAAGGIVPEFIYSSLAVYAGSFLALYPDLMLMLRVVFIAVMLFISVQFWLKKPASLNSGSEPQGKGTGAIYFALKGFVLGLFNPQLLPFWTLVLVYFNSTGFLQVSALPDKVAFIVGTGAGALLLLVFFIFLVGRVQKSKINYLGSAKFNKAMSVFFVALAIHQTVLLLKK